MAAGAGVAGSCVVSRLGPGGQASAASIREVATYCNVCFWKCGAIATVSDGRLWKIVGNPRDPLSRGRLCPRGTGGIGTHFDTDRLRAPLVRVGGRGEERWQEVTWDEAIQHVAIDKTMVKIPKTMH